jgi:hypothetical protein
MKQIVRQWLDHNSPVRGVFACSVRFPDETSVSKSWSQQFAPPGLENAWRCLAEIVRSLQANRFPVSRLRWIHERALLFWESRSDGIWLGVFTSRDAEGVEIAGVQRLVAEFHALSLANRP